MFDFSKETTLKNMMETMLNMAEIGYLAQWYNTTFQIVVGEVHGTQLQKLRDFLSGY